MAVERINSGDSTNWGFQLPGNAKATPTKKMNCAVPWGDFHNLILCQCALWSHTYIPGFIQIRSGLPRVITEIPSRDPQSDFNISPSSL